MLLFNGSLYYGWLELKKSPSSISAMWYTDVNLVYRWTVLGIAMLSALHLTPYMIFGGMAMAGILVFPKINLPKEKLVHDIFAVLSFVLWSLEVHWVFIPVLVIIFFLFKKKLSLYWLEIIGFNVLFITKLLLL